MGRFGVIWGVFGAFGHSLFGAGGHLGEQRWRPPCGGSHVGWGVSWRMEVAILDGPAAMLDEGAAMLGGGSHVGYVSHHLGPSPTRPLPLISTNERRDTELTPSFPHSSAAPTETLPPPRFPLHHFLLLFGGRQQRLLILGSQEGGRVPKVGDGVQVDGSHGAEAAQRPLLAALAQPHHHGLLQLRPLQLPDRKSVV